MKYTKLISTTVLGAMALGMATPALAAPQATDPKVVTSDGKINFIEDDSPEGVIDPENPGENITPDPGEGVTPGLPGPLQIVFISNLDFGTQKATLNGGQYQASATTATDKDGVAIERGNFVQVADKRFTAEPGQGWTLSAQLTKQFTEQGGTRELNGSTINYTNPNIVRSDNQLDSEMPTAAGAEQKVTTEGSTNMMNAASGQGFGNWAVEYGNTTDGTQASSVILDVPSRVAMTAKQYDAEITWTLAELTPAP